MKAIILAAGRGSRLGELSNGQPKSMIEIDGKSLLHRQIESCQAVGITKFVFVLGFMIDTMRQHIYQLLDPKDVTIIENPDFATTNTLHSLWLTRHLFDEDFIYFNADVLFAPSLLKRLQGTSSRLLVEHKACGAEEVKVIVDNQNYIRQIGKKLDAELCLGEFIGVGQFSKEVLADFAAALQLGVDTGQSNNYFEWAVNELCPKHKLMAVDTAGQPCIEVDFPEDLQKARTVVWPLIKQQL